jgi:multiple sugar transport system permease protein
MAKTYNRGNGIIREFDIKKPSVKIGYAVVFIICLVMFIVAVFPILWVFFSSFKTLQDFVMQPSLIPTAFNLKDFWLTWQSLNFVQYYINTLYSVVGCVICAVVFNGLLAYGISKVKPIGSNIVYGLVLCSLMIPATTSIVTLFININKIGLVGSFIPLWLSFGANAFFVVLYKSFFDSLPQSLVEAARIDGCSNMGIFFKIVLPLSMAINMVIVIYAVNAAWSDFLLPFLVLTNSGRETVMVELYEFSTSHYVNTVELIRAIVFALVPPVVLFAIFQRQIVEGVTQAGIKG